VGFNGVEVLEREEIKLYEHGPGHLDPFSSSAVSANSAASNISVTFGIKGICTTIATGCSAGLNAIGFAYDHVKSGRMKIMFAGGTEASISPLTLASFDAARTLSTRDIEPERASRPFDKNRDGMILGEGAGILVVETLAGALDRNASIYAEIVGYSSTSDAYSTYKVDPTGKAAARAMHQAIREAGIKPADISYINAHGSSSQVADVRETNAIKMIFQDYAYRLPVSSIKSMIGHPFAAAGSLQMAACLMAINDGVVPPTINYEQPDPNCDLDYVPNQARDRKINYALINSLGMGGNNASMVLGNINN
jgi:3-oxoacyl-[acyl-carrier-protein] synthase II